MANTSVNSMVGGIVKQGQNHDRKGWSSRLRRPWVLPLFVAGLSIMARPASAATVKYCSNYNTGESFDSVLSIYQSHGACTTTCTGYAFAILQGNTCWCSNFAPNDSSASCTESCPGYPDEKCGDTANDAYAYVALAVKPSGTKGPTSTKATVSSTSLPSRNGPQTPVTSISTVTTEKKGSVATVTTISTAQQTSKTEETSASSTSKGDQSATTTNANGKTSTVTIPPTSGALNSGEPSASSSKSGISGGAIAGIVIGVVAGLLLLVGAFLLWHRRQKAAAADDESPTEKIAAGGAGRRKSAIGLGSGAKSPNGTTLDGSNITPTSSADNGEVPYDPRLDPHSVFARYDATTGSSRMSVRSLRDDADYSRRVLRLANPDTDE